MATVPDIHGRFGPYGGRYVPETLMHALRQLAEHYDAARADPEFQKQLDYYLRHYVGRPSARLMPRPNALDDGSIDEARGALARGHAGHPRGGGVEGRGYQDCEHGKDLPDWCSGSPRIVAVA